MKGKLPGDTRARFGARGEKVERLSTYFNVENASKPVLRHELHAILDRIEQVREHSKFWPRLWRFLRRPFGSNPAIIAPTKGEIARGELTEEQT